MSATFGGAANPVAPPLFSEYDSMARSLWSSHPISNYQIGRFKFNNTVLDFNNAEYDDKDEQEFKKLHDSLPPIEKNRIKLIDVDAAEELVKRVLASKQLVTQVTDSSHGRDPREVGTGSVEESLSQQNERLDQNGDALDPTIYNKTLNQDPGTPGVVVNGAEAGGTGDATSGENHGAGNLTGTAEAKSPEELAKEVAGQGTLSAADQKAAADLVREEIDKQNAAQQQEKPEDKPAETQKPKLGGLNLNNKTA